MTGTSAWAAWAKCDRGATRGDGPLKCTLDDSAIIEAMAVVNGLVIAQRARLIEPGDTVLIQTDNNAVMDVLEGTAKRRASARKKNRRGMSWKELRADTKRRNDAIREVAAYYRKLIEGAGINVLWRHCRGHMGVETKRAAVNTNCDTRAKARMKEARREHLRRQANLSEPWMEAPSPLTELPIAA